MRIVAGQWRGRTIEAPPGLATRPTADRVREALFSMLASRIGSFEDLRTADLFAGSGALGLEALSRGATTVTFAENAPEAAATIRRNAARLGVSDRVNIISSALALPAAKSFDLIFADPPYSKDLGTRVIDAVLRSDWLAPGGWMSVETSPGERLEAGPLSIETIRDVGPARITLLRRT